MVLMTQLKLSTLIQIRDSKKPLTSNDLISLGGGDPKIGKVIHNMQVAGYVTGKKKDSINLWFLTAKGKDKIIKELRLAPLEDHPVKVKKLGTKPATEPPPAPKPDVSAVATDVVQGISALVAENASYRKAMIIMRNQLSELLGVDENGTSE